MRGRSPVQLALPIPETSRRQLSTEALLESASPTAATTAFPDLEGAEEQPFEVETEPLDAPALRSVPAPADRFLRARSLAEELSHHLAMPVQLSVTDNRSTMISFRRKDGRLLLRVHHMFLLAPGHVVRAVADYAGRSRREASPVIDAFVREHTRTIRVGHARSPTARLTAQGRVHDLRVIFDRINDAVFAGRIDARIGWGRAPAEGRRRTIRMGVYDHLTRTIRIHPALDRSEVPGFFVEYIVFHEMLHQAVPGEDRGSRRQHHGPEFRRRERAWPGYERAVAWERENLSLLLGKANAGKRARPVD